jgi:cell division protein ZapA (FtsZ GTPase activity inhibitor)
MVEILKADIFFFVTTVVVVIVGILLITALAYLVKIIRDIRGISKRAKSEADFIFDDVGFLRRDIKTGTSKAARAVHKIITKTAKTATKSRKK